MKLIVRGLLLSFLCLHIGLRVVWAEFICSGELSYTWKADKEDKDQTVPWIRIEQTGPEEETAKSKLAIHLAAEKNKARAACKRTHENQADCVATKYASMEAVLQKQTFNGRKALEDAIASDCTKSSGLCKEIVASDPQCKELKKEEPEAADAKKDAGKKDAKAKK